MTVGLPVFLLEMKAAGRGSPRQIEVVAPADEQEARPSSFQSSVYVPAWHVAQVLGMVDDKGEAGFDQLAQLRTQIEAHKYGAAAHR